MLQVAYIEPNNYTNGSSQKKLLGYAPERKKERKKMKIQHETNF